MPTAKKTKVKSNAKSSPENQWKSETLKVLSGIGRGIIDFFKFIFDFVLKLIQATFKFIPLIIGSIALLIISLSLSVYLLSATIGLKENPKWQEYISSQVDQWAQAKEVVEGKKDEEEK